MKVSVVTHIGAEGERIIAVAASSDVLARVINDERKRLQERCLYVLEYPVEVEAGTSVPVASYVVSDDSMLIVESMYEEGYNVYEYEVETR